MLFLVWTLIHEINGFNDAARDMNINSDWPGIVASYKNLIKFTGPDNDKETIELTRLLFSLMFRGAFAFLLHNIFPAGYVIPKQVFRIPEFYVEVCGHFYDIA